MPLTPEKISGSASRPLDGSGETAGSVRPAKFTEGPWQSQHDFDRDGLLTIVGGIDGPDDGQWHYTTVCEVDDGHDAWQANARLIAAAPDLLDALAGLLGLVDLIRARGDLSVELRTLLASETEHFRITDARAALAKARGE